MPWRGQSVDLLRQRLGREPTHVEIAGDYAVNVALSFYIRELFLHPDRAVQENRVLPIPSEERILDIFAGGDYIKLHRPFLPDIVHTAA